MKSLIATVLDLTLLTGVDAAHHFGECRRGLAATQDSAPLGSERMVDVFQMAFQMRWFISAMI
jgi:hypothetical protein